jgi:hypothetical protein
MRTVDLTFDKASPLILSQPRETRSRPLKGRASNAGFKYSKSFGSKPQLEDLADSCRVEGVSISKMRSSKSNYLKADSAILAQEILKEQEEILGILENSAFLTHSLTRMNVEGLSEHQHFIRTFEEVERAKLRLMYGPYPSRDYSDGEDVLSTISVDSLEISPKRRPPSTNTLLSESFHSSEVSLREGIFREMDSLLCSDTEEPGAEAEREDDCLEDIQQELQKRIPSKLEFHRESSQEREGTQAGRRRDRYRLDYQSDEDIEGLGMEPRQSMILDEDDRLRLDSSHGRAVSMMGGSLPEWLVLCVRSYQSVFLNDVAGAGSGSGREEKDRGEDDLNPRLARSARRFLQVERYLEKMEREVSEITIDRHERGKRRGMRRLRGQQPQPSELESSRRGRGGSSRSSNQRELMSRSVSSLVSREAKQREAEGEGGLEGMKDDGSVEYHAFHAREGQDSQAESTVRKGRMLLLSAAISFGDVVGEMIAREVEGPHAGEALRDDSGSSQRF